MRLAASGLALLVALALPASAQEPEPVQPMTELAVDLAYGFCPQFMNGDAGLADNEGLTSRGFGATPEIGGNARLPEFGLLGQTRMDGEVTVGGIAQSICQVSVIGSQAEAALVTMRSGIDDFGLALEADIANSGPIPQGNGLVETLKMPLPGTGVVRVQFLQASLTDGTPLATFQIMFQEQ